MKNKVMMVCFVVVIFTGVCVRYSAGYAYCTHVLSSCVLYPFLKAQQYVTSHVHHFYETRKTMHQLMVENAFLQHENAALKNENYALKAQLSYVNALSELISFKKRYHKTGEKIVSILVRHLSPEHQFFLVNAGTAQGVHKDMVALYGNALLGKVTDVYPWYCKVTLITDQHCSVAAVCSQSGAVGIHEGINQELRTTLHFVSHLEQVNEGDLLLSSGEGLIFPQGFALGTIETAVKGDLVYDIEVKPVIDLRSISYCTLCSKADLER